MAWLMVALFFLSGLTALVGEVVWMRMLGLALGNTIWAASTAVAVWMAGMAIGARFGARLASRTQLHLRWYGAAEVTIGLFYIASPALHRVLLGAGTHIGEDLGSSLALGMLQRFGLAAAALALPTILMGLTLPLLVERLRGPGLTSRVSLLYGINTLGASAGVFTAGYFLLPTLGETGSLAAAAILCTLIGGVAILAEHRVPKAEHQPLEPPASSVRRSYLVLVAAMGLSALAAELVWVRILVLHLGSRVYAFALLLGVYLLGIAIGSLVIRAVASRIRNPVRALARTQILAAVALVIQLVALGFAGDLIAWLSDVLALRASFAAIQGVFFTTVVVLFLPVTVLFGASFPLAVAADPERRTAGEHAGIISAANTLGAIAGAVAAPFLLVPWIGCQRTLLVLTTVHLGVALALRGTRTMRVAAAAVIGAVVFVWFSMPSDWVLRQATAVDSDRTELIELVESLSATVLVKRYDDVQGTWFSLELNGVNVAGTEPSLLAVQQLQGNLPMLLAAQTNRVLHIGFGSGGTCWSVTRYPIERVDLVEIAPEVLAASDTHFAEINRGVLKDPKVNVVINDGRNFLLATDSTYDAILSDSIHPLYAGNSTLYTREYFEMCRARLRPGGVTSMWLPIYSLDRGSLLRIIRAFHEVFPQTVIWYDVSTMNEFTVVTGMVEPGPVEVMWERAARPEVTESLRIANVTGRESLMANVLLAPDDVARLTRDVPAFVDDLPYVEYTAGRLLARDLTWYDNMVMLFESRTFESPFPEGTGDWDGAVAYRDRRLREILDRLLAGLEGAI